MPRFGHVFLLVVENTNFSSVAGSSNMPYLNSLISRYGLATNYYATTHPSIGNYYVRHNPIPYFTDVNCGSPACQRRARNIAPLIASAAFQKNGLLIITADENSDTDTTCSTSSAVSSDCGGRVATVVISPLLKSSGIKVSTFFNHFSLLRTLMQALGLPSLPGVSSSATSMSGFFGRARASNPSAAGPRPSSR